eukprot:9741693-Alexandrium_andersonii.AAC.1
MGKKGAASSSGSKQAAIDDAEPKDKQEVAKNKLMQQIPESGPLGKNGAQARVWAKMLVRSLNCEIRNHLRKLERQGLTD